MNVSAVLLWLHTCGVQASYHNIIRHKQTNHHYIVHYHILFSFRHLRGTLSQGSVLYTDKHFSGKLLHFTAVPRCKYHALPRGNHSSVLFANFPTIPQCEVYVLTVEFEDVTAVDMNSSTFLASRLLLASCWFLACLKLRPEDGGDIFHRNSGWLSPDYRALYPRR
jgi:hypothetical protein